jgi:phasin
LLASQFRSKKGWYNRHLIVQRNISVALHQKSDYIILNRRLWRFQRQDDGTGLLSPKRGSAVGADPCDAGSSPSKDQSMSEAIDTSVSKSRSKAAAQPAAFEMPKFELPNFEIPKMEIPAAFREIAEKSVSQAKETYEKMKSAAEEATDVLEDTYAAASKGASDYGLKVIEAARANTNAAFDFATQLMTVKSLSEMVELSTAHTRKQFEALTTQSKELAAIAQKVATDSAEPVKESFGKVFKKVA